MMRALLLASLTASVAGSPPDTATVSETRALAGFGSSLALTPTTAFVGERGATSGVVHVYTRGASGWRATGKFTAGAPAPNDGFGAVLAASATEVIVSQLSSPFSPDSARGLVHVYRRQGDQWRRAATLLPDQRPARAEFGAALVLAGDLLLIGAPGEGGGVVYLYRREGDAFLAAGRLPAEGLGATDRFGSAIAFDQNRIVVGAPGRASNRGAVFVFSPGPLGDWAQEAVVSGTRTGDNARLGATVLIRGNRLVAAAPSALPLGGQGSGGAGMVVVYDWSPVSELWRERRSFTAFDVQGGGFGRSLAWAGPELWIGAPFAERGLGRVFRVRQGADSAWGGMNVLEVPGVEPGAGFAGALAVAGDVAAVGMPNDAGGEGSVIFLSRNATGAWTSRGTTFPEPTDKIYAAVKGGEVECGSDGKAKDFECGNASLIAYLPIAAIGGKRGTQMNDNWGWTDTVTKREIAILGRTDGTSFVDVTDAANPRYLGDLPKTKGSPPSSWRDMKIYKDHVFIVSDNAGEHGMQVFDLTRLRRVTRPQTLSPDVTYDRINSAHNIVSNEETGFMYTVGNSGGGETCGGGYHMVDVREPKKPKFAGCFGDPKTGRAGTGYSHDAMCVVYRGPDSKYTGREICIGSNETAISIADLTDKKNPVAISRASYPNVAYAHQAWLTDDHRYLYLDDEGDESSGRGEAAKGTRTLVWDLADLSDPILIKEHVGVAKAIDHNLYVKGDRMYQANYTSGLRILDISDPRNPKEVAFLDTHPGDDGRPSFDGAWSVYPFFKSGAIVVTSIGEGMFLVRDRSRKPVQ